LPTRAGAESFVGRDAELARLKANVEAGANTLVLAERGAGLTSLLNRVAFDLDGREELRVVLLSGEVTRSAGDLLAAVGDRLAALSPGGEPGDAAASRPDIASGDGAALLWRVERLARLAAGLENRVVVMIDGIGSAAVAHTVFGQLRNELWQMERITWVFGGATANRGRYLEPPADAFWESLVELKPLSNSELYTILVGRRLAGLPGDTVEAVLAAAAGNPMRLLVGARTAEEGRLPGQLEHDSRLSESAASLLHYLQTHGASSASDKGLLAELGWSRGRAQQVFKALEAAGLVTAELAPTDGAPGRPRKVYELTEAAR
jgi:hypothetical protein